MIVGDAAQLPVTAALGGVRSAVTSSSSSPRCPASRGPQWTARSRSAPTRPAWPSCGRRAAWSWSTRGARRSARTRPSCRPDRPRATCPPEAMLLGELDGVGYWALHDRRGAARGRLASPDSVVGPVGRRDVRGRRGVARPAHDGRAAVRHRRPACSRPRWPCPAGTPGRRSAPSAARRPSRVNAGWATRCTGCGREEYPRTDPAVICLVHDERDQRRAGTAGPPTDLAAASATRCWRASSRRASRWRPASRGRSPRRSASRWTASATWAASRGRSPARSWSASRRWPPIRPTTPADGEIEEARWVPRAEVRAALAAGGDSRA